MGGRQKDGTWDSSKCTHGSEFGRTWLPNPNGNGEYEICDGCGRRTGNTR
jgi:hypothetical protein